MTTAFYTPMTLDVDTTKKKFDGFKTTRPNWCPIEPNTYHGWKLEVEKEDTHG